MNISLLLAGNSIAFGGLLFLLSAGFSLIFGLMRIPNLTHGSLFMLGAYFGVSLIALGLSFWPAAVVAALGVAAFGGLVERLLLRRLPGHDQDMLPLALVVVILGGSGSLIGSFVGSFVVGFLYNFGQAMLPELAYVVLFLPMLVVLVVRPEGLFGRAAP